MAGHLQHLKPSKALVLSYVHSNHDQEVKPERSPEPQASETQSNEAAPIQQRGRFDQSNSQL